MTLNNCYVCNSVSSLEEHHIIPRHLGGEKGPTVTLCASCHGMVHSTKPSPNTKIAELRHAINKARAFNLENENPNRKVRLNVLLNKREHEALVALCSRFNMSQRNIVGMILLDYLKRFN